MTTKNLMENRDKVLRKRVLWPEDRTIELQKELMFMKFVRPNRRRKQKEA